jgi:LL-diaminopimelate aminotransferase
MMKGEALDRKALISASERLSKLPPYLFAELDRKRSAAVKRGLDIIDFGIGDPDTPTPPEVVEAGRRALLEPSYHRYPRNRGSDFFLEAARRFIERDFRIKGGVEVAALIGSKEGIAHVPMVFCNRGDIVLVPNPGYPVYRASAILADAIPVDVPLQWEHGFVPALERIPPEVLRQAKVLFVNYPNNPTGAVLTTEQMERIVRFARENDLLLASDNSYSHIRFDGVRPASLLEVDGADEVVLEFHSLSKTFCMTGWRVGFVAGSRRLVTGFTSAKENIDSGVFTAIQAAAAAAMDLPEDHLKTLLAMYRARREALAAGLLKLGWEVFPSPGTFYLWVRLPRGADSMAFAGKLVNRAGIMVTPGSGFGSWGEGFIRFALTVPEARIHQAVGRLEEMELYRNRLLQWLRKKEE